MTLEELKYALHKARVTRDYWRDSKRATRKGITRAEGLAKAQAEVDRLEPLYHAMLPVRITKKSLKENFIGPTQKRKRNIRPKEGPITCCKCEKTKPRDEFYATGTRCRACAVLDAAAWAEKNPEKSRGIKDRWERTNIDQARASRRDYRARNRDAILAYERKHYIEHKKEKLEYAKSYVKRRKKSDPKYRALLTCKRRMWILFKSAGIKKVLRSAELLGTDRAGFFAHIESLWLPGMTWANRGRWGWHIDHIKPCKLFDMTDPVQAKACWHYTNLQPLWWRDNLKKSDSYHEPAAAK